MLVQYRFSNVCRWTVKDVTPQWWHDADRQQRLLLGAEQLQAHDQAHRGWLQAVSRPDGTGPGACGHWESLRQESQGLVKKVEWNYREGYVISFMDLVYHIPHKIFITIKLDFQYFKYIRLYWIRKYLINHNLLEERIISKPRSLKLVTFIMDKPILTINFCVNVYIL